MGYNNRCRGDAVKEGPLFTCNAMQHSYRNLDVNSDMRLRCQKLIILIKYEEVGNIIFRQS
jgi:hypothetical protein